MYPPPFKYLYVPVPVLALFAQVIQRPAQDFFPHVWHGVFGLPALHFGQHLCLDEGVNVRLHLPQIFVVEIPRIELGTESCKGSMIANFTIPPIVPQE